MGFCNCSLFCCVLLCVHSSFVVISMGMRELVALLCLSSLCLMVVVWRFLAMPWVNFCLQFVVVVYPDHTHYLYKLPPLCHGDRDINYAYGNQGFCKTLCKY